MSRNKDNKPLGNKTYNIITFGCQMNEHDSEVISGMLSQRGYLQVPDEDRKNADIVIINTCSIRENADQRFFGTLGQLKKIKIRRPDFTVCVCGCMMQQDHVTSKIRRSYPWVDVVFGTHNIHEFPEMLEEMFRRRETVQDFATVSSSPNSAAELDCANGQKPAQKSSRFPLNSSDPDNAQKPAHNACMPPSEFDSLNGQKLPQNRSNSSGKKVLQIKSSKDYRVERIYEEREEIVEGLPAKRLFRHKSFVNIMYGCNNFCTYCIVPYTRGREKSRTPEQVISEVRGLVADGVKEVTLLGQNVNSYRGVSEETGKEWDFTDLIYGLDRIEGLERIRFMTSHPKDLSDRLIAAFADCKKLCNYIHLPVQAGSSDVLKRMNRKYTREQYLELVRKLRQAVPGIAISTDIIVGFPGETEEDFDETLSLAQEVVYDSAFTFLYSPRKGTPAESYEDQIPEEIKHERFNRLVDIMNEGSKSKNAVYVGRICDVLVDGPDKKETGILNGRTEEFKLVDFEGPEELIGQIVQVEITDSNTFSLRGKLI